MFAKNFSITQTINYRKNTRFSVFIHLSLFGLVVWAEWCNFVGGKVKIIAK